MPENNKIKYLASIGNSVRTPLGFFTVVALILDGILFKTVSTTDQLPMWMPWLLFGLLVVLFFTVVMVNPLAMYHPSDWPARVSVSLVFPVDAIAVDLDIEKCLFEVRDVNGQKTSGGHPNLTFLNGGWTFQLPMNLRDHDSIRLELIENGGTKWKVNPFPPYHTTVPCIMPKATAIADTLRGTTNTTESPVVTG